MPLSKVKLYYVYDPMCSWCWGYKPTWNQISEGISDEVEIIYVVGGLAPDSDVPMPEVMQQQIKAYWKKIEDYLGTQFNYDFWVNNTPRRSTYPACRAILAARAQGAELAMLNVIQEAYYLNAKNPSDNDVLLNLAQGLGLDITQFKAQFLSEQTHQRLLDEIAFARSIGGNSFPSLLIEVEGRIIQIPIDYQDAEATIIQIRRVT
ncbi:DsbA family protein (plasmid) [Photobacterium sp. DA100]|uniref:DsbA family protein n=1 Tax=Photobacterium sp. DA100 TaxID=3027472 RepID=UPI002478FBD7|nr:DsbA family protein [Photobacterium sp. DA100]WEM45871.1 DsbA family protein [Photobacterium sp. DA100]